MDFEWDPEKEAANIAKHGINFTRAASVFEDRDALEGPSRTHASEERYTIIGHDLDGVLLFVVYTWRSHDDKESCRIISARKIGAKEFSRYQSLV